jgi:hypothetical protein
MGAEQRTEPLVCVECGASIGTLEIDAEGMHGDPIRVDDSEFKFGGHYMGGVLSPRCSECGPE